ncbi:MAG: hypothetical protein IH841_06155 [Thaumarchaeota archaeon]|nr:hypothetical protein [Nitrososphaerota archaeon]
MNWILGGIAIALLIFGLVGQAFEMRQIRVSTYRDEDLASSNIFMNKRNFKWYALIGAGVAIWYLAQGSL